MDHFDLIDVPIQYFISLEDNLVRPDDALIGYLKLREINPAITKVKLFDGFSHIDFTYLNHHTMINEVMKALRDHGSRSSQRKKPTQRLPRTQSTDTLANCQQQLQELI